MQTAYVLQRGECIRLEHGIEQGLGDDHLGGP
jgi:hypothetical protein